MNNKLSMIYCTMGKCINFAMKWNFGIFFYFSHFKKIFLNYMVSKCAICSKFFFKQFKYNLIKLFYMEM